MKKNILVTGGAGYIGSITARLLLASGYTVTIIDNLSNGKKESIPQGATFIEGSLLDKKFLTHVFAQEPVVGVIHFAAFLDVAESIKQPGKYFENNVLGSLNLLDAMQEATVSRLLFSSTCSVYGDSGRELISENTPCSPLNPYAESKYMVEKIIGWYRTIYKTQTVILRYFNVAGASLDGQLGETHPIETHIIPVAMKAVMQSKSFDLFGEDYDTPDGTCIRDYIHVVDLAQAHCLALEKLIAGSSLHPVYNVGTGKGYSNREILSTIESVTKKKLLINSKPRRQGDPERLVADPSLIQKDLHFSARHSDLLTIIETAWGWEKRRLTR